MVAGERVARNPRDFWMATCGIDTHARGSGNARNDTPWVAFTADRKGLVCTIWEDQIARVVDPRDNRARSFVMLGGKSTAWKAGAVKRGREAEVAITAARTASIPIFGFEAVACVCRAHLNTESISI
ncbi:hypothetical protein [Acidovorax sp. sic0104]|uniref:hypothetical protein n=1 Tax=Acidovorax sp. sic0104 TaxID=2854784 RepID=UPI001C46D64D|nr:hypothetical protein [Acidovorax sp. sic0104]MBV7541948.1 hypothetical protein [Acidovorax sp. sic0104]